jgi:PAT family beta-lactamase induction signal transducer AmpG
MGLETEDVGIYGTLVGTAIIGGILGGIISRDGLGKWLLPMIGDALAYNRVYFIIAFQPQDVSSYCYK